MGISVKQRNANMELLRMISMCMVTVLHALGKSDLLVNLSVNPGINGVIAWVLESISIGAVNIFMLISGYFLINSEFKIKRLVEIVMQAVFYTVFTFGAGLATGVVKPSDVSIYYLLNEFFPVHMEVYWFITAYVVIYMLLPVITKGAAMIPKKRLQVVIIALVIYECGFKSFLPFRFTTDSKGYSFLWYLIVFLVGAYLRLYGFKLTDTALKGWIVYGAGTLLVLLETFAIHFVNARTGHLAEIYGMSTEYNNVFVFAASLGIFAAFLHLPEMNEGPGRVICVLSPMALGVYLFQENLTLRYLWQGWFGLPESSGNMPVLFFLRIVLAVVTMYVAGTLVDALRKLLFKAVYRLWKRLVPGRIGKSGGDEGEDENGEAEHETREYL